MRQFILIVSLLFAFNYTNAAFPVSSATAVNGAETAASNIASGDVLFNKMCTNAAAAFEQASHRKLNFYERFALKSFQKKAMKSGYSGEADTEGFNIWGFLLGLLLGPIGVLASFIFSKDRNLRRWAWWGFRFLVLIATIVFLV